MSMSNRERVDRGFLVLRDGLNEFIDNVAGTPNWDVALSEALGKKLSRDDVQTHLVMLTQKFDALFKPHLSYMARTYSSELRDIRNKWAHQAAFSSDDTYRMLDSAERLLVECGQPEQAELLRKSRVEHQRLVYEAETKKAVKDSGIVNVAGQGLKPWREVIKPHADVATGQYTSAEFAADLHMVAIGEASAEYGDPVAFFNRTYLTEGLKDLLTRAARRLSGDANASPIVNLQTNFGGGKTHSMLALYHLASGTPLSQFPQEVQDLLAGHPLPPAGSIRRVTLVGTYLMTGKAILKPDGTEVNTLWGELAWQLGGRAAYDVIAESDRTRTNPGVALRTLLASHGPALILIDEWVAYARQLYGRDDLPAGTFDTQFTFAQTLTEVAKSVPGVLVVISIPASSDGLTGAEGSGATTLEVGGQNGLEALARLQNVVRRVADQWRPATAEESFEIVRRRLFEEPDAAAQRDIAAVARQFVTFYATHRGEFPREAGEMDYERRIRDAYPIHPELFDRLYQDWSTLERFQRTRGVLRLMSAVVHALWKAQDSGPLIMSGSVPLNVSTVASELTQYLPDSWKPIVDADVDGEASTPAGVDADRPLFGQRSVTRRLARTVFIGSAPTVGTAHKGIEKPHVWLGTAIPGDTVGNFGSAIDMLSQRATYFYVDGSRYWYDTQASVTRTAADIADRLREHPEDVWVELVRRLRDNEANARGDFAAVHLAPESSAEVPDTDVAKLVILAPAYVHKRNALNSPALEFAGEVVNRRGAAQRVNRNTVVLLAPDSARMEELAEATREFLAWNQISQRITEMNLTAQQATQVANRRKQADQTVDLRIPAAYHWAIVPVQPDPAAPADLDVVKAEGAADRLADRVSAKMRQGGLLATTYSARSIRMELNNQLRNVWDTGHVSVGDLWGYYCKYPYLMRLRNRAVLDDAVAGVLHELTWEAEGFALASGFDADNGNYLGLTTPHTTAFGTITDTTLLVAPPVAIAQMARLTCPTCGKAKHDGPCPDTVCSRCGKAKHEGDCDQVKTCPDCGRPTHDGRCQEVPATCPMCGGPAHSGACPVVEERTRRFYGAYPVSPERHSRDFARVAQEVIAHLGSGTHAHLKITVEIEATDPDGFTPETIRTVLENARTLKFDTFGFEKG